MEPPITTWPGNQAGYMPPMQAAMGSFGRIPMFDAHPGHRYQPPFNMNLPGELGQMATMILPGLLQGLMPQGMRLGQFNPEQQLYDQFQAQQFYTGNMQAAQLASGQDTRALDQMLGGITKMFTGEELTDVQQARNYNLAGGMSKMMPMLSMILGPDMVDQLHGSRGSATIMSQQLHQAMRTAIDPVTGRVGYSGESAGRVTQEVFAELFGEGADISAMKGISAGQAGMMMNDLQSRGLLGRPMGTLPFEEQRTMLPKQLDDDVVNRIAETLKPVQDILKEGGVPSESILSTARQQVRDTHAQMIDPTRDLSREELESMPGGEEIIRATDADRISSKLKNISGAVKAMRDIFGDMGNPNAPMREIINGLEALTQGGMATMSASEMEATVRKTHNLAKQTGIGVQGIMALTSQNAALADEMGLDRGFAVTAAQQSAAFGAAAAATLALNTPAFGAPTKEELVLADSQLRMQAARSPLSNQLGSLMRMADTGMVRPKEDTELAAMIQAVRLRKDTYQFDGKQQNVVTSRINLQQMLERDAGLGHTQSWTMLSDLTGNQEFSQKYQTETLTRRTQTAETAAKYIAPAFANQFRGTLQDSGVANLLIDSGIVADDVEFRVMMDEMGNDSGVDFFSKLSPADIRDDKATQEVLGKSFRDRFREAIARRSPDATDAEVDELIAPFMQKMGGQSGQDSLGTSMFAAVNRTLSNNAILKDARTAHSLLNQDALNQGESRERQAEATSIMQTALSGLGTAGPIRRIVDTLQTAGPKTTIQELMAKALGGVDMAAMRTNDPTGVVAQVMGLVDESTDFDPNDPEQMTKLQRNAAMIRGLVEGGAVAKDQLRILDESRPVISPAEATDEQKKEAVEELQRREVAEKEQRDAQIKFRNKRLDRVADDIDAGQISKTSVAALRSMAPSAENEIALGGNRFLSNQGISERDADGNTISISSFENVGTSAEALNIFEMRAVQQQNAAVARDQQIANRTEVETYKAAQARGLFRGAPTIGTQELYDAMTASKDDRSAARIIEDYGYLNKATLSSEQIHVTAAAGKMAEKSLQEAPSSKTAETISDFVMGSYTRAKQLIGDDVSMHQLGRGGLELVRNTMNQSRTLQSLAQEQSEKLGREVTLDDLLRGKDVDSDVQEQAATAFTQLRQGWDEISQLRKYELMPGKGQNVDNKRREEMTPREKEDLELQQSFMSKHSNEEERAVAVMDRLVSILPKEQGKMLNVDVNREKMLEAITSGNRSGLLNQAIDSREGIINMALSKGLFGEKTKASDLTPEERFSAVTKLESADLDEDETADLQRMKKQAMSFLDFGSTEMKAEDIPLDALSRVNQFRGAMMEPLPASQKQELGVKGTVTVKDERTALLDLTGIPIIGPLFGGM